MPSNTVTTVVRSIDPQWFDKSVSGVKRRSHASFVVRYSIYACLSVFCQNQIFPFVRNSVNARIELVASVTFWSGSTLLTKHGCVAGIMLATSQHTSGA